MRLFIRLYRHLRQQVEIVPEATRIPAAALRPSAMTSDTILPNWSRAHGGSLLSGRLRHTAEDFVVTEVLGFEPDATGEHDYLRLEKTNANTTWVARKLAAYAGIPARDVGFAGMKDRHAVTRQWFSVRRPAGLPADWSALDVEGVRVLEVSRNTRKLRRGAHAGNRFRIVVRDVDGTADQLDEQVASIATGGVPAYFGEQRFGRDCGNLQLARMFFGGRRMSRDKRSIALSSARAWLFNHVLQERVVAESWGQLEPGDIAMLDGTGSIFSVDAPDADLQQRCAELDLHPTGPLWGKGGGALESERTIIEQFPEFVSGLEKHTKESRRGLRMAVRDFVVVLDNDARTLTLDFYLARGGFATAVLRELVNYSERRFPNRNS